MSSLFGDFNVTEAVEELRAVVYVIIPILFLLLFVAIYRDWFRDLLKGLKIKW